MRVQGAFAVSEHCRHSTFSGDNCTLSRVPKLRLHHNLIWKPRNQNDNLLVASACSSFAPEDKELLSISLSTISVADDIKVASMFSTKAPFRLQQLEAAPIINVIDAAFALRHFTTTRKDPPSFFLILRGYVREGAGLKSHEEALLRSCDRLQLQASLAGTKPEDMHKLGRCTRKCLLAFSRLHVIVTESIDPQKFDPGISRRVAAASEIWAKSNIQWAKSVDTELARQTKRKATGVTVRSEGNFKLDHERKKRQCVQSLERLVATLRLLPESIRGSCRLMQAISPQWSTAACMKMLW
ncbi:hypothetical protein FB567DRAFT_5730 [Paraphoma chrysanthemicola]|uniref:Uncharacterized protein n=1 Tax=Paraphoma chrysanthemicola TaxID=798071 RepID=A0A8K0RIS8_9PLEO|nr:hypothetical protein FB567DRAFT_5730 [Paraphoma chrysanthemicola]